MDYIPKKTMILRFLEHFIQTSDDQKAKNLMSGLWEKLHLKNPRNENDD